MGAKMRRFLISGIATCCVLCGQAQASSWIWVTDSAAKSLYFLDKESVRDRNISYPPAVVKTAWFKTDDSLNKSVVYRSSKLLYQFKCDASEMKLVQWINYDAIGLVLDSGSESVSYGFRVAAPDTVGFALLESVCFPK
jgi:hypothetical protein